MDNQCILVISDLQIPAHHIDALAFLKEIKKQFKPTRVISIGDEVDFNALNFHQIDPDMKSARFELLDSIEYLKGFYKEFPTVEVVESNHGSLAKRRAKAGGLSSVFLKEIGHILEAPETWTWHRLIETKLPSGKWVRFIHNYESNVINAAKNLGVCVVQGHFHSKFELVYHGNGKDMIWGCTVGCLIDDEAPNFDYNKRSSKRPQLGTLVIKNGVPILLPMLVNKSNRWVGYL